MALINPLGHRTGQDSYSIRIPLHKLKAGITNEEILARFTKGFFRGWIFTPSVAELHSRPIYEILG
ncbi:hypothetical protein F4801DRAFT_538706, partial [Xylaria longipes]